MKSKRIDWIDIAKGITILLVIVGHSVGGRVKGMIYTFHMPLFFILSCTTYRLSEDGNDLLRKSERGFRHLFLPAAKFYLLKTGIRMLQERAYLATLSLEGWKQYLANLITVFVAGSGVHLRIRDIQIEPVGIPWFLMALFLGRCLFDYLHLRLSRKGFYASLAVCSLLGLFFGSVQWLPFSFDIALAIQPLFLFGVWLRSYPMEKKTWRTFGLCFAVWFALYLLFRYGAHNSYLELTRRLYPLYPLCFVGAVAGTMMVSSFSQLILPLRWIGPALRYLGKHSMVMLWVHYFDSFWIFSFNRESYGPLNHILVNTAIRVVLDIVIFCLIMAVKEFVKGRRKQEA